MKNVDKTVKMWKSTPEMAYFTMLSLLFLFKTFPNSKTILKDKL